MEILLQNFEHFSILQVYIIQNYFYRHTDLWGLTNQISVFITEILELRLSLNI